MNLENLNLVELNAQEQKETEGGFPIFGYNVGSAVINGANWVGHQASDFWNGVKSGL